MSLLSVGVENSGLSNCAFQELLELLYLEVLPSHLATAEAQHLIQEMSLDPSLAADFHKLFTQLALRCCNKSYLMDGHGIRTIQTKMIPYHSYKGICIEVEARNRLGLPQYKITYDSYPQLAEKLRKVYKLVDWDVDIHSLSNAFGHQRKHKCYENAIKERVKAIQEELHLPKD